MRTAYRALIEQPHEDGWETVHASYHMSKTGARRAFRQFLQKSRDAEKDVTEEVTLPPFSQWTSSSDSLVWDDDHNGFTLTLTPFTLED